MSRRYLDLLGAAAAARALPEPVIEYVAEITAVRSDGSVNVRVRGGKLYAVPALASYVGRSKGDVVIARKTRSGWYVAGKTGAEPVAAASGPAPTTPPADVAPTDQDSWRNGQRRDDVTWAVQGDDESHMGANTGAWFYGNALHAALTTGTVVSAAVTLTRSGIRHGDYGPTPVYLYTHPEPSPPAAPPARLAGPFIVGALELGERNTFTLPDAAVASLKDTGRGLLVYAGTDDYIRFAFGTQASVVHVTYT